MGVNYDKLAKTAESLIKSNGKPVTLISRGAETYNPATGELSYNEVSTVVDAVVTPYSNSEAKLPNTLQYTTALNVMTKGCYDVNVSDKIVIDTVSYSIESIERVNPNAGDALIIKMVVVV